MVTPTRVQGLKTQIYECEKEMKTASIVRKAILQIRINYLNEVLKRKGR